MQSISLDWQGNMHGGLFPFTLAFPARVTPAETPATAPFEGEPQIFMLYTHLIELVDNLLELDST